LTKIISNVGTDESGQGNWFIKLIRYFAWLDDYVNWRNCNSFPSVKAHEQAKLARQTSHGLFGKMAL
jgi:hypothetical protein